MALIHAAGKFQLIALSHCPLCRETARKRLFEIRDSAVYQCLNCGLRFIDPCLAPQSMQAAYESEESLKDFHGFHKGYYDYGDLETETKTVTDFRRALEQLERRVPGPRSEQSIFDVGFGNGLFLALAKKRGWKVGGIDTSAGNVELVRQKFSLQLAQSDLEHYDPRGAAYDVVSFWDVLEHLSQPHSAIQKARDLLKPGGFILIGVPNDNSFLRMASSFLYHVSFGKIKKGIEKAYFLEHVAYYELATITKLLSRNHFKLCDYFFTSTDLAKYTLPPLDRFLARFILLLGKLSGRQNRLVAAFQRTEP